MLFWFSSRRLLSPSRRDLPLFEIDLFSAWNPPVSAEMAASSSRLCLWRWDFRLSRNPSNIGACASWLEDRYWPVRDLLILIAETIWSLSFSNPTNRFLPFFIDLLLSRHLQHHLHAFGHRPSSLDLLEVPRVLATSAYHFFVLLALFIKFPPHLSKSCTMVLFNLSVTAARSLLPYGQPPREPFSPP